MTNEKNEKKFAFVIVAGGIGKRAATFKQFQKIGGLPMWSWSANTAARIGEIDEIVLVVPPDFVETIRSENHSFGENGRKFSVTAGGTERVLSVRNGLAVCRSEYVLIHDAARPFVSEALLRRLMDSVDKNTGAIPLVPVADALKTFRDGKIIPVERDGLYATQTPQAFHRERIIEALENAHALSPKDEAETYSGHLVHVEGEKLNFKITFPEDFLIAEAIAQRRDIL